MNRLDRAGPAAAAALLGLAAAGTFTFTLFVVYRLHVPLPYWDEWYVVPHFARAAAGTYGLADLASQHNEHRILLPRLFFFADERFFALSGRLDATATILLQLLSAGVLVRLGWRLVARPAHRALLAGFTVLLLFTLAQEQNFTNGFQLQFVGVFTAALLAAAAYAAALERLERGERSLPLFAWAALACAASTYTMANGVLAGFALAGLAILRRAPLRVVVATLVGSGLLAALYFHGYTAGGSSRPAGEALRHPLPYARYVSAYLGNVAGLGNLRAAQALGALGLALAGAGAWWVWRRGARDGASAALLGFALFVLLTASATAYGRIELGTEQAFESRYVTPALLFWCAVVLFWFPRLVGPGRPRAPALALGGAMAVLAALSIAGEATAWPALAARSAALRRMSDSLVSGLFDPDAAAVYEVTPRDDIAREVPFLRQHRLAAFADPDAAALGEAVSSLGPAAPAGDCDGTAAARADPALGPGGVRLEGTAVDGTARRPPRRIVVADDAGRVVGFGSATLPGEPSRRWTAYARDPSGQPLRVYARLESGALCPLAPARVAAAGG